ncbi:hypothetical protein ACIOBK_33780 [Micromonospora chokoriensis]
MIARGVQRSHAATEWAGGSVDMDPSQIVPVIPEDLDELMLTFYRVPRAGAVRLSDGGGPFGFDIHAAIAIDFLVRAYSCDAIIETGCFVGDTTEYLARRYPDLPVMACDINPSHAEFTRFRLATLPAVTVLTGDSAALLPDLLAHVHRPLVYLDAHWGTRWPLRGELAAMDHGIAVVDDFNIGHPRFAFDHYDGVECGPQLVSETLPDLDALYVTNPRPLLAAPCLQVGRRAGRAFIPRQVDPGPLDASALFTRVPLRPQIRMPDWGTHPCREQIAAVPGVVTRQS